MTTDLRLLGHTPPLRSTTATLCLGLNARLTGACSPARLRLPGHLKARRQQGSECHDRRQQINENDMRRNVRVHPSDLRLRQRIRACGVGLECYTSPNSDRANSAP